MAVFEAPEPEPEPEPETVAVPEEGAAANPFTVCPLPAPGGLELVTRGIALAGLPPRARVLDVGCGAGAAADHLRTAMGLRAVGLDLAAHALPGGRDAPRVRADGCALPVADGALDGVLLSCVLSAVERPERILAECARVLGPGGKLVVTDLYVRGQGGEGSGAGAGASISGRDELLRRVGAHGLAPLRWEDRSDVLREYVLRFVMEQGPVEELRRRLRVRGEGPCGWPAGAAAARLGYCLLVARRQG